MRVIGKKTRANLVHLAVKWAFGSKGKAKLIMKNIFVLDCF